ncbi:MAG: hypothetical protein V9G19_01700 [Tetrasphaera sp.]
MASEWGVRATRPELGWSRRGYRTAGSPTRRQADDGEWGVGIPLQRPALSLELAMAALAGGLLVAFGFGARRIAERGLGVGPVVGMLGIALFAAFFGMAAVAAHRLRAGPGRWLLLTPTRLITPVHTYRWDELRGISAEAYWRQGSLRRRNLIVVQLLPDAPNPLTEALPRVGRWVARQTRDQMRLAAADELDVDPWRVIRALQELHADPGLRARLGAVDGPGIVAGQDAGRG